MHPGAPRTVALLAGCPLLALTLLVLGEYPFPFTEELLGWESGKFSSLTQGKSLSNAFLECLIATAMGVVSAFLLSFLCRRGAIRAAGGANFVVASVLALVVTLYFAMPLLID